MQTLPKVQADESADALTHRAVLWRDLTYEWAVDNGQVSLKTVINAHGPVFNVDLVEFYDGLLDVLKFLNLEFSEPLARMPPGAPRLRSWNGRKFHLVERSDWLPLALNRRAVVENFERWAAASDEERESTQPWATPLLPERELGQGWIRIAESSFKVLNQNLIHTLRDFAALIRARADTLRCILAQQQAQLTETEIELLNNHLDDSWADIVEMIPSLIRRNVKARKLRPEDKNRIAASMLKSLQDLLDRAEMDGSKVRIATRSTRKVFVSYSHADKRWLDKFRKMLSPLVRNDIVDVWYDGNIKPSERWRDEIKRGMESASIAVMLVSDNFLDSEFIAREELPYFLAAAKHQQVKILWVALSHCLYEQTALKEIQAVNDPGRPLDSLTSLSAQKAALKNVCQRVAETIAAITALNAKTPN